MKKSEKRILEDIQAEARAKYGDKLWKMVPKADVMIQVLDKAINNREELERNGIKMTDAEIDKLKSIRDSHILEGEEKVMDMDVAKEMDEFMGEQITKAIKEGRLPHPNKDPYYKKIQQYARRNKKD